MDWPNERYIRIYTRDTVDLELMPWEARCLLWEAYRKCDRAGVIDLGKTHTPEKGLAALLKVPLDVVTMVLKVWLEDGCFELCKDAGRQLLVSPNFIEAQEASSSNAERCRATRERRRDMARLASVTGVTQIGRDASPVTERASACVAATDPCVTTDTKHVIDDTNRVATDAPTPSGDARRRSTPPTPPTPPTPEEDPDPPAAFQSPESREIERVISDQKLLSCIHQPRLLAEQIAGDMISSGKPIDWVTDCIRGVCAKIETEEAAEPGRMPPHQIAGRLRSACKKAHRPETVKPSNEQVEAERRQAANERKAQERAHRTMVEQAVPMNDVARLAKEALARFAASTGERLPQPPTEEKTTEGEKTS